MKEGWSYFGYSKVMVGHEECDTSRWVWITGRGDTRVFENEWLCPVCGMFMGVSGSRKATTVDVPVGCLFIADEVAV